ncbi:ERVV2 protein, partial [Dicrurus megarhynchus]|nr:ERVV2 protein [Dicrurus megarhynchus]
TGFHSFVRALISPLGLAQLEKAIVNISADMERIADSMGDALERLQTEAESLKGVVFQKRVVLDIIPAHMGGVCTLVNPSCCTYVDQSGQISTDVH